MRIEIDSQWVGVQQEHGNRKWIPLNFEAKLSITKTVSAAFPLNNKEAKRELKVNFNNETLSFCPESKYLGVTLDLSTTYRRHWVTFKKLTSRVALLRRLAGFGWGAVATTLRIAASALVHSNAEYCAPVCCRSAHTCLIDPNQRRLANCDWMPASYTSGQPSNPRRHPTCWASSQWGHTVSSTPCHGAWTPVQLSAHLSVECILDTCSTQCSPVSRVQMHGVANGDNQMYPSYNNSSVHLTTITILAAQWAHHQCNAE